MPDRPADSPRLLAGEMARATGLDLPAAQRLGHVSPDEVSDVVATCARCRHWQECPEWLEAQQGVAPRAPGYCLNRAWFEERRRAIVEEALS